MWLITERMKDARLKYWIAGVFINHEDALEYLSTLPSRPTETRELREILTQEYPLILVQDFELEDYIFLTLEELADKLSNLKKINDDDHEYFKYHIFQKDYRGFSLEKEYYAWDEHHHVDNNEIKQLIWSGLTSNRVGNFVGIYRCNECGRQASGILSENGYGPPLQWQIIPQIYFKSPEMYLTVCSEKCKLNLIKNLSEEIDVDE